jgi:thymidylate kinase
VQRHLPEPDDFVVFEIGAEDRVRRKAHGRDKFERDLPLLSRVRDSYRRQAEAEAWEVVDGARPKDAISEDILARVRARGLL